MSLASIPVALKNSSSNSGKTALEISITSISKLTGFEAKSDFP